MTDRTILYAAAFLRALATGMVGVLIGIYLAREGLSPTAIGLVISAGLAGAAVATLLAALHADRMGRRRALLAVATLTAGGGLVVACSSNPFVLAAAAFVGMMNGMGRDRGAALVLDQAILPATVVDAERTRVLAVYNLLQDVGHAFGGLLAGLPAVLRQTAGVSEIASLRLTLVVYVALSLAVVVLYRGLTPAVEPVAGERSPGISLSSRRILRRISALFALDSLAGGFLLTALLSFFFFERFGVDEAVVGPLFFFARLANALSHLLAAWLAARIGLVNTMVFTHVPASLLLVAVPFAPSFAVAAALFLLREALVEMDVPTRQSYVLAVVRPEERTIASGVTHLVRLLGWTVGPSIAGALMQGVSLATPLFVGAATKILYDVLLYLAFRGTRPPEEA